MKTITVQRIEQLIKDENETANSFAKKVGITANSVYNLLDGGQPRIKTLEKIVSAYPSYTLEFLTGRDTKHIDASEKFELDRLRKENEWLKKLVERLTGERDKIAANFKKASIAVGATKVVSIHAYNTGAQMGVRA
jgi:transcriptional regulator with XRE-family HTH domain